MQAWILIAATAAIAVVPLRVGRNAPFGWPWNLEAAKAKVAVPSQSLRSRPEYVST